MRYFDHVFLIHHDAVWLASISSFMRGWMYVRRAGSCVRKIYSRIIPGFATGANDRTGSDQLNIAVNAASSTAYAWPGIQHKSIPYSDHRINAWWPRIFELYNVVNVDKEYHGLSDYLYSKSLICPRPRWLRISYLYKPISRFQHTELCCRIILWGGMASSSVPV